jgi:hypothetical protein
MSDHNEYVVVQGEHVLLETSDDLTIMCIAGGSRCDSRLASGFHPFLTTLLLFLRTFSKLRVWKKEIPVQELVGVRYGDVFELRDKHLVAVKGGLLPDISASGRSLPATSPGTRPALKVTPPPLCILQSLGFLETVG